MSLRDCSARWELRGRRFSGAWARASASCCSTFSSAQIFSEVGEGTDVDRGVGVVAGAGRGAGGVGPLALVDAGDEVGEQGVALVASSRAMRWLVAGRSGRRRGAR